MAIAEALHGLISRTGILRAEYLLEGRYSAEPWPRAVAFSQVEEHLCDKRTG